MVHHLDFVFICKCVKNTYRGPWRNGCTTDPDLVKASWSPLVDLRGAGGIEAWSALFTCPLFAENGWEWWLRFWWRIPMTGKVWAGKISLCPDKPFQGWLKLGSSTFSLVFEVVGGGMGPKYATYEWATGDAAVCWSENTEWCLCKLWSATQYFSYYIWLLGTTTEIGSRIKAQVPLLLVGGGSTSLKRLRY